MEKKKSPLRFDPSSLNGRDEKNPWIGWVAFVGMRTTAFFTSKKKKIKKLFFVFLTKVMDPSVEESVEEAFQQQADLIAYYLGLEISEVQECLRNPSSPKCRVVWRVAHDQFLILPEDDQWTLALELDLVTLENLCKISLIMRRFCIDETFWQAKFFKDVGRKEKYFDHEEELWKENYVLAFTHSAEPIQDLSDLEVQLMAINHEMTPPTLEELVNTFRFYELARFRESMIPVALTEEEAIRVENTVIALNLFHTGIIQLFPEITTLSSLQKLYLYGNQLTTLPREIGNLSSLQILNLSHNQLTTLPPEIGNLSSLQKLYLHENQLTTLPPEITSLSSLQYLHLSLNLLTTLPPEIGSLSSLQNLYLAGNHLTTLPPEIGSLYSLQYLRLGENDLTTLPPEITTLPSLQELHLSHNQLTTLPPEIGNLSSLQKLDLGDNQLTTLPPEIGSLYSLQYLHLGENDLTTLPPEIGYLRNLQYLDLSENPLTTLPREIVLLTNLRRLFLVGTLIEYVPTEIRAIVSI